MERILSEQILAEMIRRVVEVAHPQRLILFGSAARGDMGPHSDVDLLVVVDQPFTDADWRRPSIATW